MVLFASVRNLIYFFFSKPNSRGIFLQEEPKDLTPFSCSANYAHTEIKRPESKQALSKSNELSLATYLAPELRTSQKELRESRTSTTKNTAADIWALAVTLINLSEAHYDYDDPSSGVPKSGSAPAVTARSSLSTSDAFRDFIGKCLVPFADQRADAVKLLSHRFITGNCGYANPQDSAPTATHKADRATFNGTALLHSHLSKLDLRPLFGFRRSPSVQEEAKARIVPF